MPLKVEDLRKMLCYNPRTGNLTWLPRAKETFGREASWKMWNTRYAGKTAGSKNSANGNIQVYVNGICHKAHRIAWALQTGEWPAHQIGHHNHNKCDNRFENLYHLDRAGQFKNQSQRSTNTTGYTGVHWDKSKRQWKAHITVNYIYIHLGYFHDIKEAVKVRKAAEKQFGFHPNHGRPAHEY